VKYKVRKPDLYDIITFGASLFAICFGIWVISISDLFDPPSIAIFFGTMLILGGIIVDILTI